MKKDRNLRKNAYGRLSLLVFLSLVLGINIYTWNAKNLTGNTLPMPFGYGVAVVLSGSMEPVLSVNDLVFIKATQEIETGDIIVYQSGKELIIHRVIAWDGETCITQGDANNIADAPIQADAVRGVMVGRVPAVGALVRLLKNPAVVIGILILAFLLSEGAYRRERKQDSVEIEQMKEEIRRLKEKSSEKE